MTTLGTCCRTDCKYHMDTVFPWENWCKKNKITISPDGKCMMFERKIRRD